VFNLTQSAIPTRPVAYSESIWKAEIPPSSYNDGLDGAHVLPKEDRHAVYSNI
jgi:hypothetical protein